MRCLCSIGFGPKKLAPSKAPKLVSYVPQGYVLTAKIYQAGNLPAGNEDGTADPYVVVRCASQAVALDKKEDTLFPFWYD